MGTTLCWKSSVSWLREIFSFWNWTTGSRASSRMKINSLGMNHLISQERRMLQHREFQKIKYGQWPINCTKFWMFQYNHKGMNSSSFLPKIAKNLENEQNRISPRGSSYDMKTSTIVGLIECDKTVQFLTFYRISFLRGTTSRCPISKKNISRNQLTELFQLRVVPIKVSMKGRTLLWA